MSKKLVVAHIAIIARPAALALALLLCLGASASAQSNVTTFATGFEFPRGPTFGPDGNLYVAEAGAGGDMSTIGMCPQTDVPYTSGFTGRVSKVTPKWNSKHRRR